MNQEAFSVSAFYRWNRLTTGPENILNAFADAGAKYLVFDAETTMALPQKKDFVRDLCRKAQQLGLTFRDAHAPWGPSRDLNDMNCEDRLALHENILPILGDCGIRTVTFHIGASCIYDSKDWFGREDHYRSIALKALERFLKTVERYDMTLCVENCFEPSTVAWEAMNLVQNIDSPHLGLCLDCGHANLMEPMEGRDITKMVGYVQQAWNWETPAFTEKIAEFMMPHIVTVHVHDNDGLNDKHALPDETGTIDWKRIREVLSNAPRLISLQSEVETKELDNIPDIVKTLQALWA